MGDRKYLLVLVFTGLKVLFNLVLLCLVLIPGLAGMLCVNHLINLSLFCVFIANFKHILILLIF